MPRKPMVTIKVGQSHSKTYKPGTKELLEEFLELAGVYGSIQAILGLPFKGKSQYQGLEGVRVVRVTGGAVETKVQPRSNNGRRVFFIIPPPGLAVNKLFDMMKKAQMKLRAEATHPLPPVEEEVDEPLGTDEEEDDAPALQASPSSPVLPALPTTESEEDRLTREYYELDAQNSEATSKVAESRRRLTGLERDQEELVRAVDCLEKEIQGLRQRVAKLDRELTEANIRKQEFTNAIGELRSTIEVDEAMASEAATARDAREAQITEMESQKRVTNAAQVLKAVSNLQPAELLEALRRAGVDVNAVLGNPK